MTSKDKKKQPAPSGESIPIDTVAMTEELAKIKARKYEFGYFDADDIKQEIWISINRSIDKYDPERTKRPQTFFNVVSENYLKNLVRDTRDVKAANVDRPIESIDNSFEEFVELRELVEYVVVKIEDGLRPALISMINGDGAEISSYMKGRVKKALLELLEMYRNE